jgi:hypothetical protein
MCTKNVAVSTGRCNADLKFTGWSFKAQSLPRALIEAQGYFVEIGMRGDERVQDGMFSYVSLEQRVPLDHRCVRFAS